MTGTNSFKPLPVVLTVLLAILPVYLLWKALTPTYNRLLAACATPVYRLFELPTYRDSYLITTEEALSGRRDLRMPPTASEHLKPASILIANDALPKIRILPKQIEGPILHFNWVIMTCAALGSFWLLPWRRGLLLFLLASAALMFFHVACLVVFTRYIFSECHYAREVIRSPDLTARVVDAVTGDPELAQRFFGRQKPDPGPILAGIKRNPPSMERLVTEVIRRPVLAGAVGLPAIPWLARARDFLAQWPSLAIPFLILLPLFGFISKRAEDTGPVRDAPCPCGSGRKYKNCCGKQLEK